MLFGLSLPWVVVWSLWGVVVFLDFRRDPRDLRWLTSLIALVVIAGLTRTSLAAFNMRFALLCGLAFLVIAAWMAGEYASRRKRAGLGEWARARGLDPVAPGRSRAATALPEGLARLPMLGSGRLPRVDGLLRGDEGDGRERLVFHHEVRRGPVARGTVVAIRTPGARLPLFQVRPAALFPWMDGGPLGDEVATTHGSTFSKLYRLGGHEPRNLRAIFSDDLLAAVAERPGWLIEGEGEWVAAFYYDRVTDFSSFKTSKLRTVPRDELEDHVREASKVLDRIAERAVKRAGQGVGAA